MQKLSCHPAACAIAYGQFVNSLPLLTEPCAAVRLSARHGAHFGSGSQHVAETPAKITLLLLCPNSRPYLL